MKKIFCITCGFENHVPDDSEEFFCKNCERNVFEPHEKKNEFEELCKLPGITIPYEPPKIEPYKPIWRIPIGDEQPFYVDRTTNNPFGHITYTDNTSDYRSGKINIVVSDQIPTNECLLIDTNKLSECCVRGVLSE